MENVTLSIGMARNGNNNAAIASGVEQCECPDIYAGSSCQDPADGYYRWRNTTISTNILEDLVGKVVACECNERSESCDRETGECLVSLNLRNWEVDCVVKIYSSLFSFCIVLKFFKIANDVEDLTYKSSLNP